MPSDASEDTDGADGPDTATAEEDADSSAVDVESLPVDASQGDDEQLDEDDTGPGKSVRREMWWREMEDIDFVRGLRSSVVSSAGLRLILPKAAVVPFTYCSALSSHCLSRG